MLGRLKTRIMEGEWPIRNDHEFDEVFEIYPIFKPILKDYGEKLRYLKSDFSRQFHEACVNLSRGREKPNE